jgi:16S rRNA processing protein RimM
LKSSNKPTDRDDLILVGRVTGAHGIRGALRVHSYAESIDLYRPGEGISLALADGSTRNLTLQWVCPHGRGLRMGLESVNDRNQAESLVGSLLYIDKARLPALEDDTYYWFELMGLSVYDTAGVLLGRIDEVIPTAANDVYVVKGEVDGRLLETLIPAVGDVVCEIDLEKRTMIVDPPEGL